MITCARQTGCTSVGYSRQSSTVSRFRLHYQETCGRPECRYKLNTYLPEEAVALPSTRSKKCIPWSSRKSGEGEAPGVYLGSEDAPHGFITHEVPDLGKGVFMLGLHVRNHLLFECGAQETYLQLA